MQSMWTTAEACGYVAHNLTEGVALSSYQYQVRAANWNRNGQEKPIVLSRGFSPTNVGRFWRNATAGLEPAASAVAVRQPEVTSCNFTAPIGTLAL